MVIRQGELYWLKNPAAEGSVQSGSRPHLVVQSESLNVSKIGTILVCPLTSQIRKAGAIGNVLLREGEGGLDRDSVVLVAQIFAASRSSFSEYIGTVNDEKVREVAAGIRRVTQVDAHLRVNRTSHESDIEPLE